jgi:hypothetical protein
VKKKMRVEPRVDTDLLGRVHRGGTPKAAIMIVGAEAEVPHGREDDHRPLNLNTIDSANERLRLLAGLTVEDYVRCVLQSETGEEYLDMAMKMPKPLGIWNLDNLEPTGTYPDLRWSGYLASWNGPRLKTPTDMWIGEHLRSSDEHSRCRQIMLLLLYERVTS